MASDEKQQPLEVDPAFAALIESYSAAVEDGRMEDATKVSDAVMEAVVAHFQIAPDPDILRAMLAHQAEADCEWDVARQIYKEDLEAASRDRADHASSYLRSQAYRQLANVESCCDNPTLAFALAQKAVEAVREGDSELATAIALESFAGHAMRVKRNDEASEAANEGLEILPDDRSHGVIRTQLLVRLAEAAIELNDLTLARDSAAAAWAAITPWSSMKDAAGVQMTTARLWRIDAQIRELEATPWHLVRAAWQSSVATHRHIIDLWEGDGWIYYRSLAETLDGFAKAADRVKDSALAAALRAESKTLTDKRRGRNVPFQA